MSVLYLTNSSPGAPTMNGVNGSLCAVLDWALVQQGWAIEYSSGNARVYRPGTGNRNRLHVNHDSAVSGDARRPIIRGCENASSATVLVDPFPLASQRADTTSNWLTSVTADATARPYTIILTETFIVLFVAVSGVNYELGMFGDVPSSIPGDLYNTICYVRATSTATSNSAMDGTSVNVASMMPSTIATNGRLFWARDASGATKSSQGCFYGGAGLNANGAGFCQVFSAPLARAGYGNRIYRERLGVSDTASATADPTTLALVKRAWVPNLWNPVHAGSGTVVSDDTFTDVAYNPSAAFVAFCSAVSTTSRMLIVETTDTWSPP